MPSLIFKGTNLKGILKKAKEILFDKTGTSLNSTNVQDAIVEINNSLTVQGTYTFTGIPFYTSWGNIYMSTPIPIRSSQFTDYSATITGIWLGGQFQTVRLTASSSDSVDLAEARTMLSNTLNAYFNSSSPLFTNINDLRNAGASISIAISVTKIN